MADEQQDKAQKEATDKSSMPQDVQDGIAKQQQETADERGKFLRLMEKGKDVAKTYGEPDFPTLLAKVGSDSVFAQRFVRDLVANEQTVSAALLPDAPQENNVTGKLDHSGDVAVKQKTAASTDVKPPAAPVAPEATVDTAGVADGEKVN